MPRFSIKFPYLIIVCCLIVSVIGFVSLVRMPVDLFPKIKIPVVVVATFYSGMPAEQIETSITGPFERFFTIASGIHHIESRSLPGVSLIKIFFQPGTDPDSAVTSISNLAMADLRRLPPGTLPPVVLKFDASSLPVCLITLKAQGLSESELRDLGQFNVRNQVANIPGAAVPQPFGGKYRQIMIYVDPVKLEAYQLSIMDVVRTVNEANLILPAGDVRIGPIDYALFSNSQTNTTDEIKAIPLKTIGTSSVTVGDVGQAVDGAQIQMNIVRVDSQPSVYLPILKQGGDSNTIEIVDGVKNALKNLVDVPKNLITKVVFDQSIFVKNAIENLVDEGTIGLGLTALMVLIFLGSLRATLGVFFSIPLSVLGTFAILALGDNSVNSMILGGLALAFSRLIDNSVVVLENIYRHLELGELPHTAAEQGGREVALPVLASTLTTAIVFFPVTLLYGVSKYLFMPLALTIIISLIVSYIVALTVVPLFCANYLGNNSDASSKSKKNTLSYGMRFHHWFNQKFEHFLTHYDQMIACALKGPKKSLTLLLGTCLLSLGLVPLLDFSYFPRTDPGQFLINLKAPTGTRIELTEAEVNKVEDIIRRIIKPEDLDVLTSNIGAVPDFSAMYTSNTATHTAFIQTSLKRGHKIGSYEYMGRVREALQKEMPELITFFQTGGLVDAVLNLGLPAPFNIQVLGADMNISYSVASEIARRVRLLDGVSDVFIPQDIAAPALQLEINREHASQLGLTQREIVSNVITALTSNQMIAPNYWIDPKTGNDYMLTVQFPEEMIKTLDDLKSIPILSSRQKFTTHLDMVAEVKQITAPTLISHFQLARVIDIYVSPKKEDLGHLSRKIDQIITDTQIPDNTRVAMRGSVEAMHHSFKSFGVGILLSMLLVYLVLVAQFKSFMDPLIILLAIPPGLTGTILILLLTGTTLNIMSLMGLIMLVGISVSNSILIVEFTHNLRKNGMSLVDAVTTACRVRLRPILMTSLATIFGLIPMALALGSGSEAYASLARVIIGGLILSVAAVVFLVPTAYVLFYQRSNLGTKS